MSAFDDDIAVERVDEGRYRGVVQPTWGINGNPNGGYLLSIVLAALADASTHPDPISVTTHYLRPGSPDKPCDIAIDVVRTGRSVTTLRGRLIQEDKARLEVLAAFSDLSVPAGVDADITISPPDLPPPEDCISREGDLQGIEIGITSRLDVRLHPDLAVPGKASAPEVSGWIRFRDGRAPDTLSLPLFTDTFPPSPFGVLGVVGWVPTLELTVHVRRRPAEGWIRTRFVTDDIADGRMIETGALWDSEGRLVAQSRQIGLVMRADN